jgi:DNA-binding transcriptional regulator YhcF (GntR family)
VDRLRDRILVGRYFGRWGPGDRLPSVRDVARHEEVDRKTAAAAYRRLQREGLVRVEPRSGVYLGPDTADTTRDPLRRLHAQWLESALTSAAELGLTSAGVARMLHGVARIEAQRIPVIDEDAEHATVLARELAQRTSLQFMPAAPHQLRANVAAFRAAPFAVATPAARLRMEPAMRRTPVVAATLEPQLLERVGRTAAHGPVAVVVGTRGLRDELRRALDHGLVDGGERVRIVLAPAASGADGREALDAEVENARVVLWPGTPAWAVERWKESAIEDLHQDVLLSAATLARIMTQLARTTLENINTSSGA